MLLELRDLSCQRGDGRSGIRLSVPSLSLDRGEALAVTGPSGCGKSTLLDIVGLVLRPDEAGRFRFAGGDMAAWWAGGHHDRLARARAIGIGYVLQTGGLLPFATVRDNIRLSPALLGQPIDDAQEGHLVETLGIGHLLDKKPAQLSIGERQRVAIARALAHRPPLILADEPTASLDPVNAAAVIGLLMGLVSEMKLSLVVVSHDWSILERFRPRRLDARIEAGAGGTVTRFAA